MFTHFNYSFTYQKRKTRRILRFSSSVLALPIFPGRLQPSIVGRSELNFRVRDGNGWTLTLINTNYILNSFRCLIPGTPSGTRTLDTLIKSQVLYQLS